MSTRLRLSAYLTLCSVESVARSVLGSGTDSPGDSSGIEAVIARLEADREDRSLVVFAPTIGEFNAVRPFIAAYLDAFGSDRLVILTSQAQYLEPIANALPDAQVGLPESRSPGIWARFFRHAAPRLVIFAEGPALHGRFPLRLELPLPAACLRHAVPLCVVNARLYEKELLSRIDQVEHALFRDILKEAVHHWYAPDSGFRDDLIAAGVPAEDVTAVGDLKYDGAAQANDSPPSGELAAIVDHYAHCDGPVLVAGSVNAIDDQMAVVCAWRELKERHSSARLVIAPRYVNNQDVMDRLCGFLGAEGLPFSRRSEMGSDASPKEILIVDVFGELRFYYGVADICYVGRNHGLLEPLRFGKPTVAADDWRDDHPSYPLYAQLIERRAVIHVRDKTELGQVFLRIVEEPDWTAGYLHRAREIISANKGAAAKILKSLKPMITSELK